MIASPTPIIGGGEGGGGSAIEPCLESCSIPRLEPNGDMLGCRGGISIRGGGDGGGGRLFLEDVLAVGGAGGGATGRFGLLIVSRLLPTDPFGTFPGEGLCSMRWGGGGGVSSGCI